MLVLHPGRTSGVYELIDRAGRSTGAIIVSRHVTVTRCHRRRPADKAPIRNSLVHAGGLINDACGSYIGVIPRKRSNEQEINMRAEDHIDRMLDAALDMTFPASDPIAVYIREPRIGSPDPVLKDVPSRRRRPMGEPRSMPLLAVDVFPEIGEHDLSPTGHCVIG